MINYGKDVFYNEVYCRLLDNNPVLIKDFATNKEAILFCINQLGIPNDYLYWSEEDNHFKHDPKFLSVKNIFMVGYKITLKNGSDGFCSNVIQTKHMINSAWGDDVERGMDTIKAIDKHSFVRLSLFITSEQYKRFMM
ncbi:hypothetical protein AB9_122 [Acinetobacter phage vB_AbaM_B9]|nr:hypothetical protein AB9_122 [Acinetobacter phage vB_AbaM_B9]